MKQTIYQLLFLLIGIQTAYSQSNITISSAAKHLNSSSQQVHMMVGESVLHKGAANNTQIKAGFHYTIPTAANNDFTFFTDKDTVQTGDTISVAIRVSNVPTLGIASFDQFIQFDTSKLTYVDYSDQVNLTFVSSLSNPTQIPLSYFQSGNTLTDSMTIGLFRFVVKMGHGSFTRFSLASNPSSNVYDPTFNSVPYTEGFDTVFTINPVTISGKITTDNGTTMPYVSVVPSTIDDLIDTTDMIGNYTITTMMGASLSTRPERKDDTVYDNGINMADIITIMRHIQGTIPFSYYKEIAANVSSPILGDCLINSFDLYLIRQVILGSATNFGGEQYNFVPSSYTFPNGSCDFPDSIAYPSAQDLNNQGFIGIKLGDVTNDWNNNLRSSPNGSIVSIGIDSSSIIENSTYTHEVTACGMQGITAYQMTITWDSTVARLDQIIPNSNWSVTTSIYNAGTATILFFDVNGQAVNIPDNSVLFNLQFTAIGAPGTSTIIEINSAITPLLVLDNSLNSLIVQTNTGLLEISTLNSLPIKLSSFNVKKGIQPISTVIDWRTTMEVNTDFFDIEWSTDGVQFESIATLPAQGTSNQTVNYHHTHLNPIIGANYYRLKTVDKDGSFEYSTIKALTFKQTSSNDIHLFPNPFQEQIYVQLNLGNTHDLSLQLLNVFGQTVAEKNFLNIYGKTNITWDLKNSNLPSGTYFIKISIDGQIQTQKLTKL